MGYIITLLVGILLLAALIRGFVAHVEECNRVKRGE